MYIFPMTIEILLKNVNVGSGKEAVDDQKDQKMVVSEKIAIRMNVKATITIIVVKFTKLEKSCQIHLLIFAKI